MTDNLHIIVTRDVTKNLYDKYTEIGMPNLIFISDQEPTYSAKNVYTFETELLVENNFYPLDMTKGSLAGREDTPTAWDKAFWYLKNCEHKYDHVWFIEDDCYINKKIFNEYLQNLNDSKTDMISFGWCKNRTSEHPSDKWYFWDVVDPDNKYIPMSEQAASLNVITRLSWNLIGKVLEFQEKNNKFIFFELLVASLAKVNDMTHRQIKNELVQVSSLPISKFFGMKRDKYMILHPMKQWYDQ